MNIQAASLANPMGFLDLYDIPDLDRVRLADLTTIPESRLGGPISQIEFKQISPELLTLLLHRMIDISKSPRPIAMLSQVWRRDVLPVLTADQGSLWITNVMTDDPDPFVLILDKQGIWLNQCRTAGGESSLHTHCISIDHGTVKLEWNGQESDVQRISELLLKLDDVAKDLQIGRIVARRALVLGAASLQVVESHGVSNVDISLKHSIRIRAHFGIDDADLDRLSEFFNQQLLPETARANRLWNAELKALQKDFLSVGRVLVDGGTLTSRDQSLLKGLLIYLKVSIADASEDRPLIELVINALESLNILPIPIVNMAPLHTALEKISKSPIVEHLKKLEVPLDRWKTKGWADPREQFLKSHFFKAELLDGGTRTYTGIMLSQSEFDRFQLRSKYQVDSTLSYDTALGKWEFCRHLDSDHIQEKSDVVDRIVSYIQFLNSATGSMAFLKKMVVRQCPGAFMIYNGDGSLAGVNRGGIVGTEYLYRTHYNHIGNVWHMSKMANSTEKGADLGVWMEEVWAHRASFRRYVLAEGVSSTVKIWDLLDHSEIFYKLGMDERVRVEFQGQYLSRVLKRYMKMDSQQMAGVRHMHEKMESTLALGYAARRLEKGASGDDKQVLADCVATLETDPFKKIRATVRQIGRQFFANNPEIKKIQPDHDVAALEKDSSSDSGGSDNDWVPRTTVRAVEAERDRARQSAETERQEKLKERQEKREAKQREARALQQARQERERADALQRQLDELQAGGVLGKKRSSLEMKGGIEK